MVLVLDGDGGEDTGEDSALEEEWGSDLEEVHPLGHMSAGEGEVCPGMRILHRA